MTYKLIKRLEKYRKHVFITWSVIDKRNNADDNLSKVNSKQIDSVCRWVCYSVLYLGAIQSAGIQ